MGAHLIWFAAYSLITPHHPVQQKGPAREITSPAILMILLDSVEQEGYLYAPNPCTLETLRTIGGPDNRTDFRPG